MRWLIVLSGFLAAAAAADWPRFRGPNGAGVAEVSDLPAEIGPAKNVLWKAAVPPGYSSPVLVDKRIYLTGYEDARLLTMAFDADTGKQLWQRELPRPRKQEHPATNGHASASAAADSKRVVVFFEDFGMAAYTPEGRELWRMPLGPFQAFFGLGASPILVGDAVIMVCDADTNTFILAADASTGRVKWRRERPPADSFTTPVVFDGGKDGPQVIVLGGRRLISYSVSTGEPLWWLDRMPLRPKPSPLLTRTPAGEPLLIVCAQTPGEDPSRRDYNGKFSEFARLYGADEQGRVSLKSVAAKNRRDLQTPTLMDTNGDGFVTEEEFEFHQKAYGVPNVVGAIRLGEGMKGEVESRVVWRRDRFIPNTPTPLVYQGVLYVLKEGGILSAYDAATGEPFKQGRLTGALAPYLASLVGGDGKVYAVSDDGRVAVIRAGRQWELLAVNDLGEPCGATPALSEGRIFLRTRSALYAFANGRQAMHP